MLARHFQTSTKFFKVAFLNLSKTRKKGLNNYLTISIWMKTVKVSIGFHLNNFKFETDNSTLKNNENIQLYLTLNLSLLGFGSPTKQTFFKCYQLWNIKIGKHKTKKSHHFHALRCPSMANFYLNWLLKATDPWDE